MLSARAASAATTVGAALADARAALARAGCSTPGLDAEVLLAWALGADRATLHRDPERVLDFAQAARFAAAARRRADREPVAYVVGRRGFRHIELAVDPRVLVPRPETELLVDVAVAALAPGARVVDVGTGSGAVALALEDERPDLAVTATDISSDALAVAAVNARRLGLDVEFVRVDLLADVLGPFDAVVSNPPYVATADAAGLAPEIAEHEPPGALLAGSDGLAVIRRLVGQAAAVAPLVALELGEGQAPAVRELMRGAGLGRTETHRDLAGIERVVVGNRC